MSASPDSIHVEMQFSGTSGAWTDVTKDVSVSDGIRVTTGMNETGPTDRVADTGTMVFSLKNDASNSAGLVGYYSPGGPNCRAGFQAGITVRLRIVYDGVSRTKFYGRIAYDGISIIGGSVDRKIVKVEVRDWMEQSAIHDLLLPTLAENKRIDEIVPLIVANMPIAPLSNDYKTGDDTYSSVFDTVRQNTKAMTEFQKVALSEMGYVYILPNDILVVEGRSYRASVPALTIPISKVLSGFLLQENGDELLQENGSKIILNQIAAVNFDDAQSETETSHGRYMYNTVETTCYPRRVDASAVVLYTLSSPISIKASETKSNYKITYRDADTGAPTVSGFDMIAPAATTDYLMNTQADGLGTNKTADLTVTVTYGTEGAEYTLVNGSASDCFITKLQARGFGVYLYDPVRYTATDSTNVAINGSLKLSLDLKYQDDPADAEAFTDVMLSNYKDPTTVIENATFYANKNNELLLAFMYCNIGSKIHLKETVSGVDGYYFINGVEFNITDNNFIEYKWIVKSADKDIYST